MLMATAFFRTIILYLLLIAGLRLTGKRQIGELEPIELVLTMLLSDLASVPMQDFDSPLINGVVPILTLLALTTLLSYISFRSGRFRSLICGEPAIVVRYGKLQQRAMRHNRMTVDELLEELRGQGVTDLKDVQYAVLETSGQVSVLLRSQAQPVTPRQLSLNVTEQLLPVLLINDGRGVFTDSGRVMPAGAANADAVDIVSLDVNNDGRADLVIANIIADIIIRLFDELDEHLAENGKLLASGIISERLADVTASCIAHGFVVDKVIEEKGWVAMVISRGDEK